MADVLQDVWEKSSTPSQNENSDKARGLHTLILNQNPKIEDNGLKQLSYALKSDIWIRSLSLKQCGITKYGAEMMINILHLNNVITKLDLSENRIPINTLQQMLKILKKRREAVGSVALKKGFRLGCRRQNTIRSISGPVNRGGKRIVYQKEKQSLSKNCQWRRIGKLDTRGKQMNGVPEGKNDICLQQKFSDLESQLLNLFQSNFKLREELLSNKALLTEQTEQRSKMESELQKMSNRLNDLKSKVVVLNCISSKAYNEHQLMDGLKYVFTKLESFSSTKQNTVENGIIFDKVQTL